MADEDKLLKAIRVIVREEVREEVQDIRTDVAVLKEDMGEVKERLTSLEERVERVETKIDEMPEQLIEMISTPLIEEDQYQDKRLTRLEEHTHLPLLPRQEEALRQT